MLAKPSDGLPDGDGWLFEPKWDGFRALVFKDGDEIYTQSRDLKPLDRYFPELAEPFRAQLPERCVLDGEVVIATDGGARTSSRCCSGSTPPSRGSGCSPARPPPRSSRGTCSRSDDEDLRAGAAGRAPRAARPPCWRTSSRRSTSRPRRRDRALAADWFDRFEGAGLDGVIAKRLDGAYQPGKRAMFKIKHERTADCVVAGFRWHKNGPGTHVGSLLLGLYDDEGKLHHLGITSLVHVGRSARPWRRSWSPCARTRSRATRGASGPSGSGRHGRLRPAAAGRDLALEPRQGPVVGAAARRARRRGRRTTTSRATGSGTRPRSSAGAPTRRRSRAATTSSRRPSRSSSRRSSAAEPCRSTPPPRSSRSPASITAWLAVAGFVVAILAALLTPVLSRLDGLEAWKGPLKLVPYALLLAAAVLAGAAAVLGHRHRAPTGRSRGRDDGARPPVRDAARGRGTVRLRYGVTRPAHVPAADRGEPRLVDAPRCSSCSS